MDYVTHIKRLCLLQKRKLNNVNPVDNDTFGICGNEMVGEVDSGALLTLVSELQQEQT